MVTAAVQNGFFVETALGVGPDSPSWIYERKGGNSSVPRVPVVPSEGHESQAQIFPAYLDGTYQQLFMRAVRAFAAHLGSLPDAVRRRVVAVQAKFGSTGDDCPWHGTPKDPRDAISDADWHNFTMSLSPGICAAYTSQGLRTLWNTNVSRLQPLVKMCPGSFIKAGMVSHAFQVNYEADNLLGKGEICHTAGYHCRGESWPFCQHGYYTADPLRATYAHLLWQLTFGVDMPGLSEPNLVNATYAPLYRVFNRYAGSVYKHAAAADAAVGVGTGAGMDTSGWVGGIVVLRDGLDSADTVRFPEATYGAAQRENQQRLLAIAADPRFKARGAVELDPVAAAGVAMKSRHRNAPNDVGWRVHAGNYGNGLLAQLAPANSSVGWWHVGPPDQPYGRFARGFEAASGRGTMAFVLDTRLWGGLPLPAGGTGPAVLKLRVTYLEQPGAAFELLYDAASGCKSAHAVGGGSSGRWHFIDLDVTDGRFGRGCNTALGSADIVLRAGARRADGSRGAAVADAIISGIEIYDPARTPP
eukprot:g6900.t1